MRRMERTTRPTRAGLAAVEWVVVLALLGLGFCLAIPAVRGAQLFARQARCIDHLRAIGLATHNYESANDAFPNGRIDGAGHGVGQGYFTQILPYLEMAPIYNAYNFCLEPWTESNATVTRTKVQTYLCPDHAGAVSARKAAEIPTLDGTPLPGTNTFFPVHYGANWGGGHTATGADFLKTKGAYRGLIVPVGTVEANARKVKNIRIADVIDGTSFTAMVAEKRDGSAWALGGWGASEFDVHTAPVSEADDVKSRMALTGSPHPAGPNVLFGDGAVRAVRPTLPTEIWYALMTRDGMEPFELKALAPTPAAKP